MPHRKRRGITANGCALSTPSPTRTMPRMANAHGSVARGHLSEARPPAILPIALATPKTTSSRLIALKAIPVSPCKKAARKVNTTNSATRSPRR